MRVHGIISSYLGDGDLDLGTVAPWLSNFTDTLFFYDDGAGETNRFYQVDYARTFPDAQFAYHSALLPSFFDDPAGFRRASFEAAAAAWQYDDDDWVIFLDATEGLGLSIQTPDIPVGQSGRFRTLADLASTAVGNGVDAVSFPFFVFVSQGTVTEHSYVIDQDLEQSVRHGGDTALLLANRALYWACEPHYLYDTQSLTRYFRCGAVQAGIEWDSLDVLAPVVGDTIGIRVLSYAYARWQEENKHDPSLWQEATDVGFANRIRMEPFRPVGLPLDYATPDPEGEFWVPVLPTYDIQPEPDPRQVPRAVGSPLAVLSAPSCYYVGEFDGAVMDQFVALWRANPRDGVWYRNLELGPVPLNPVTGDISIVTPLGRPADSILWENQVPNRAGSGSSL